MAFIFESFYFAEVNNRRLIRHFDKVNLRFIADLEVGAPLENSA